MTSSLPRPVLQPTQSSYSVGHASTATGSLSYASAKSSLRSAPSDSSSSNPSLDSLATAPAYLSSRQASHAHSLASANADEEETVVYPVPPLALSHAGPSFHSFASASSTSDLVVSPTHPPPSPFYVPPPSPRRPDRGASRPAERRGDDKENVPRSSLPAAGSFPSASLPSSSSRPPFPRPDSPLPPLPASASTKRVRAPHKPLSSLSLASSSSAYPSTSAAAALTSHTSLAAFSLSSAVAPVAPVRKATAGSGSGSAGGCSADTHRTSSDVDLDLSFEYDGRRDARGGGGTYEYEFGADSAASLLEDPLVREGYYSGASSGSSEGGHGGREETLVFERPPHTAVPVSLSPSASHLQPEKHGIPPSHLVRSESGKLVGARHERAASAMDLRARFKAEAVVLEMGSAGAAAEEEAVKGGRRDVAVPVRWVEQGEEDEPSALPYHAPAPAAPPPQSRANKRRSLIYAGFAYNPTPSTSATEQAPKSAPPEFRATFSQQQASPPPQSKRASVVLASSAPASGPRAFPLPLRLVAHQHTTSASSSAAPTVSPAALWSTDSDAESLTLSPLFDDGRFAPHQRQYAQYAYAETAGTAPSTPNQTPRVRACFEEDGEGEGDGVRTSEEGGSAEDEEGDRPVPHRLGISASAGLAGLGIALPSEDEARRGERHRAADEFPVVPLAQRDPKRVSLRPTGPAPLPSFAVSPPPPPTGERPSTSGETSSSLDSLDSVDSARDPTVSPTRRVSRRYSSAAHGAGSGPGAGRGSVHFAAAALAASSATPARPHLTEEGEGGPSVPTPTHLLATPSTAPRRGAIGRSFSFSPAPLRLVKQQLLRAAGYEVRPVPAPSPGAEEDEGPEAIAAVPEREDERVQAELPSSPRTRQQVQTQTRRKSAWWDDVADVLSGVTPAGGWLDEIVPAKLAFFAGFLLMPYLWLLGGFLLSPSTGELRSTPGRRCRDPSCGCGRMLRGSALRTHELARAGTARTGGKFDGAAGWGAEEERWAGLDRWVFWNRVAAGGGSIAVAVLVAVAVWGAAAA
ncbi:hypothetical protein JCM10207_003964 [Rhodosporidiobolus poonsookiae]